MSIKELKARYDMPAKWQGKRKGQIYAATFIKKEYLDKYKEWCKGLSPG